MKHNTHWLKTIYFVYLALLPGLTIISFVLSPDLNMSANFEGPLGFFLGLAVFTGFVFYFGSFEIIPFPASRSKAIQMIAFPIIQIILLLIFTNSGIADFFVLSLFVSTTAFFLMIFYFMHPKTAYDAPLGAALFIIAIFAVFAYVFIPPIIENNSAWSLLVLGSASITQAFYLGQALSTTRNTEKEFWLETIILIGVFFIIFSPVVVLLLKTLIP